MKRKILLIPFVLLLCTAIIPSVQATKPYKEITTQVLDGPFGDPPEFYAKGVLHGTLISRPQDGTIRVKINMIQKFNIYELVDGEAGDFLGTANMAYEYAGTVTLGPGDELILETGVLAGTWAITADIVLPEGTYKGHITAFYEEGVIVKEITKGVVPFPLP